MYQCGQGTMVWMLLTRVQNGYKPGIASARTRIMVGSLLRMLILDTGHNSKLYIYTRAMLVCSYVLLL